MPKLLLYCTKAKPYLFKNPTNIRNQFIKDYWCVNKLDEKPFDEDILNGKIVAECDFEVEEIFEDNLEDAREIFDDEDPYYVKDFDKMKDNIIHNYKDEKEFEKYLKDVGYNGSIEDFKYLYGINYRPWEDEEV